MSELRTKKSFVYVRAINIIVSFVIAMLTVASILCTMLFAEKIGENRFLIMTIADLGIMFSGILIACCYINSKNYTRLGFVFFAIPVLLCINIVLSGVIDVADFNSETGKILIIIQTLINLNSAGIHILFWFYQCASLPKNRGQRYFTVWIFGIIIVYLIMLITNPFTKILFFVDGSGKLNYSGETVELILFSLLYLSYLIYILPQRCTLRKKLSIASFAFFPLLFVIITLVWHGFGEIYNVSSFFFIFMLLAAYVVFFGDYIESKELLLRQKAELAEIKSELMLSQLNPHFVANTLNSIVALCRFDPPEAENATRLFAGYLRENYVDMAGSQMIPFDKELQNLKNYIAIEQIRFPDLTTEYNIACTQFLIPTMTMQPLVENAITHGIHGSGLITISAAETPDAYVVCIADNGAGFSGQPCDGRKRLGIVNCRNRLQMLCGGSLTIRNRDSGGAECEIVILKEEKENENTLH